MRRVHLLMAVFSALCTQVAAGQEATSPVRPGTALTDQQYAKLDALYGEAVRLRASGQADKAIEVAEEFLSLQRQWFGDEYAEIIGTINWITDTAEQADKWEVAIEFRRQSHRWYTTNNGENHWQTIIAKVALQSCMKMASLSQKQRDDLRSAEQRSSVAFERHEEGRYAEAVKLGKELVTVRRRLLGEEHPDYATSLIELAMLHRAAGEYPEAEPMLAEALAIRKRVYGEAHPLYAISLREAALLYESTGRYRRAEPLFVESLEIQERSLGQENRTYVLSLQGLAMLHAKMGDYARAEPLCLKSLTIGKRVLGEDHADYATVMQNLAHIYFSMGHYARAEPLLLRSLECAERALGSRHPSYATSLINLAELYKSIGSHAQAEPLYRRGIAILRQTLGEEHPRYAQSLNIQAGFYDSIGDTARAASLHRRAMEISEKVLDDEHPTYGASVNGLAGAYAEMQEYERAESLYIKSMNICRQVYGEENDTFATSLNNLATLYQSMEDYARAEPLAIRASEICKNVLGEEHPRYADSLNNLAALYKSSGDFAKAEPRFIRALRIQKEVFGEGHPEHTRSLHNLARLYESMGQHSRAEPLFRRAANATWDHMDDTAYALSEGQQMLMNLSVRMRLDHYLRCCLEGDLDPSKVIEQLVLWKGSILMRQRNLRLLANEPALADQFRELQSVTSRIAALTRRVPGPDQLDAWKEQLEELSRDKENLEQQLMQTSASFRAAKTRVTFDAVRRAIPIDGVLVDYLEYDRENDRAIAASIIHRDGTLTLLDLGPVEKVAKAIESWRESHGASERSQAAGTKLRDQLWQPLLPHIGDSKLILVSTDGVLGRLPFSALPGREPGTYLIEDHVVATIPVPGLLPTLLRDQPARGPPESVLLMGDVNYDADPHRREASTQSTIRLGGASTSLVRDESTRFTPLPGTARELTALHEMFTRRNPRGIATILQSANATEESFRELASTHSVLHLATHGFFASAEKASAVRADTRATSGGSVFGDRLQDVRGLSPGLLSGLAFAGANQKPDPEKDDGILTADEVAFLPLGDVDLVVLSACETGLGEVAGGEGLLGLQRAFQVAGAKTVVSSLWDVDDLATQLLMKRFYENRWEKKLSAVESLREAQLWMLRQPDEVARAAVSRGVGGTTRPPSAMRSSPQLWAAFVLSGDWR